MCDVHNAHVRIPSVPCVPSFCASHSSKGHPYVCMCVCM